jgi:hypothetical protein
MTKDEIADYLTAQHPADMQSPDARSRFTGIKSGTFEGGLGYEIDHTNAAGVRCTTLVPGDVTEAELDAIMTQ